MRKFYISLIVLMLLVAPIVAVAVTTPPAPTGGAIGGQVLSETQDNTTFFTARLYCDFRDIVKGSLGTAVGLIISLIGGYSYLMNKSGYGIFFFIAGVGLTAIPGIFDWYYRGVVEAFATKSNGSSALGGVLTKADKVTLEAWCKASTAVNQTSGGAVKAKSDRDSAAELGVGLISIVEGNNSSTGSASTADSTASYTCYTAIKQDGTFHSSNCTK